jgi:hypothetical protein
MTDQEVEILYNEMEKFFGELPNFEHHPIQFANRVKLFKYYKQRQYEQENRPSIPVQQ